MIKIFEIDGKDFSSLGIITYKVDSKILDGAGTGRMQAEGWPMFREPQGVIKNISLTIRPQNSANSLFLDFLEILDSFGSKDFREVYFVSAGESIRQEMYGASYSLDTFRIDEDGTEHYNQTPVEFIAERAIK